MANGRALRRSLLLLIRGAALIAAVTGLCYQARLNAASAALVYLVSVVLHSLDCTFPESAAVSLLAVSCLDYFFIEPRFTFVIADTLDVITLACLLTTSLIVTRLQSRAREEAAESKRQQDNMARLYKVSQELLGLPPGAAFGEALLKSILAAFELKGVCIFDANTLESSQAGASHPALETMTRDGYVAGRDLDDAALEISVRSLRVGGSTAGAIGFEGLRDAARAAPAVAALAATAMARAQAFRAAAAAAAQADAETLRSAILDALAHEIKTPLAAILAAIGGIRATGEIPPHQEELAELIESEASRLADLTSRLLRMARLDREEIRPRLERVSPAQLAETAVRRFLRLGFEQKVTCRAPADPKEVRADPDLILLALNQLLENACRYSPPDTEVLVETSADGDSAAISVQNEGAAIPAAERARVFERFYRGTEARRHAPGSGLGLYVARKIARAHGGDLTLAEAGARVVFRLSLPIAESEVPVVA